MDEFAGHFHADSLQRVPFSLASTLVGGARPVLADLNVYGIAICVDSGASESEVPGAKRNHPFFFFLIVWLHYLVPCTERERGNDCAQPNLD